MRGARLKHWKTGGTCALALALCAAAPVGAQTAGDPAKPAASPGADGTVVIRDQAVRVSELLSADGAEYVRHLIVDKPFGTSGPLPDIKAERARQDRIMHVFLAPMLKRYPVKTSEARIGGVVVDVVEPAEGVAPENRNRVLINVHGGGFATGGRSASLVESVPLASVMKIKVISIDYRMGPEHQFPAASEDVATVYRELLKQYDPSRMVLYGCSAGGTLTAQSIAWFQANGLPNPAAIGVFCSSLGKMAAGDSATLAMPLLGASRPAPGAGPRPAPAPRAPGYMDAAKDDDPLAYPLASPELLAKFPPTLFVTGTRAFEFSAALDSHNQLTKAGGESRFHGWDGLFHGFFYMSEMPESRDAYAIMAKFFDTHMKR